METVLKIINIKGIDEETFKWDENAEMIAFFGDHMTGKSTAIQSLETCLKLKGFMLEPIKRGEKESVIEYKGKDLNGNPITILINIGENNTYEFTAGVIVNNKLKTIHDVKKIKELIGNYYSLTADEVLSMVKYIEGRKKFINDYLLPLLTDIQRKRLNELQNAVSDKKNKATETNLYHTRTQLNKDIEALNIEINSQGLKSEEQEELNNKQAILDYLKELQDELEPHKADGEKRITIENKIKELNSLLEVIEKTFTILQINHNIFLESELKNIQSIISESIAGNESKRDTYLWTKEKITEQEATIERGKTKKTILDGYEKRLAPDKGKVNLRDKKMQEWTEKGQQIENYKAEIKAIYANSKLPSGLTIDDEGTINLHDFLLDDTVVSETEVKLAIVELLCQLSTSQYINIGNWTLYSNNAKKKLKVLSEKYNRCIIGQEITSDTSVKVKTIIIEK